MSDSPSTPVFVGRQPILNHQFDLVGYELLFRDGGQNRAVIDDDCKATAQVISAAFGQTLMCNVLGEYRGFINVNATFLNSEMVELLPKDKVVLEILEHVEPTPEFIQRCRAVQAAGFTLALDDFCEFDPKWIPLLKIVDFIKIPLLPEVEAQLPALLSHIAPYRAKRLAERVETRQQAQACLELGFTLFQGYFFSRPEVLRAQRLDVSRLRVLELLSLLAVEAETSALERVFKEVPSLAMNLLRMTNSVAAGFSHPIRSVRHAITALGRHQLRRWLQLLLYLEQENMAVGSPLFRTVAARARLMELLASQSQPKLSEEAFLCGLLSMASTLFTAPMAQILAAMPYLSPSIRQALLNQSGPLYPFLEIAEVIEQERHDRLGISFPVLQKYGFQLTRVAQAQAEALAWSHAIGRMADERIDDEDC